MNDYADFSCEDGYQPDNHHCYHYRSDFVDHWSHLQQVPVSDEDVLLGEKGLKRWESTMYLSRRLRLTGKMYTSLFNDKQDLDP